MVSAFWFVPLFKQPATIWAVKNYIVINLDLTPFDALLIIDINSSVTFSRGDVLAVKQA